MEKTTILIFPNGTIQSIGQGSDCQLEMVHSILCDIFQETLPNWKLTTMTLVCTLKYEFDFRNLSSNDVIQYEPELFPAAQIKLWHPIHVHAFHNGRLVLTGVKVFEVLSEIIPRLKHILPVKQ